MASMSSTVTCKFQESGQHRISIYLNASQARTNGAGHMAGKSRAVGSRSDSLNHVKNRFRGHCLSIIHILFITVCRCSYIFATRTRQTYPKDKKSPSPL
jgi:hypothetical protein